MKELGIFFLGLATGLAAGGVGMYFYTKKKCDQTIEEEIEAYAEYAEAKMEHMKKLISEDNVPESEEERAEDEEMKNNEGVKKYHHQDEGIASLAGRQPFGKKETKEKEMAGTWDQPTDDIIEINDAEFVKTFVNDKTGPYDKVTLDLLWYGTEENLSEWDNNLYWGYGTDNECLAMTKPEYKNLNISDILGQVYRWCSDYLLDENGEWNADGVGSFYVRNHNLKQDIECVVHNMKEEATDE
jgi:hypothetical protein